MLANEKMLFREKLPFKEGKTSGEDKKKKLNNDVISGSLTLDCYILGDKEVNR
jgi:hypothetical protein